MNQANKNHTRYATAHQETSVVLYKFLTAVGTLQGQVYGTIRSW